MHLYDIRVCVCVCAVVRLGVRGLQLSDFTTFSMAVSWELLGSNVRQYRVSYITARGDRAEQVVSADFIQPSFKSELLTFSF